MRGDISLGGGKRSADAEERREVVAGAAEPTSAKALTAIPIAAPPKAERRRREARLAGPGERKSRYSLPEALESASPIGYRTRMPLSLEDAQAALELLSLERPSRFVPLAEGISEQELFEESALGVLSSRQSTNFRGHRQITLGPEDSRRAAELLRELGLRDSQAPATEVLDHVAYTHIVLTRPYRTLFTHFLTFVGHKPLVSLAGVPLRALRKRLSGVADIPTIDYLQQIHLGILADSMERAAVLASAGQRRAQIHLAPFQSEAPAKGRPAKALAALEKLCGLSWRERRAGWRIGLVAQVGAVAEDERVPLSAALCRRVAANLLAFRSERIQPGVNADDKAPPQYQTRQNMDVPDELTVQAGRALYNAFCHWSGLERDDAKELMLLERVDELSEHGASEASESPEKLSSERQRASASEGRRPERSGGTESLAPLGALGPEGPGSNRLRAVRDELSRVFEQIRKSLPLWAEVPTGFALSKQMASSKKAFALAGQRIYLGGLSRRDVDRARLPWGLALCAFGAAAARGTLYCELMGVIDLPDDCDLLAGTCMMAGPINQNDVGKTFFGNPDLLAPTFADKDPTALLVWTLKAKTVADPIGNEEQLLNRKHRGPLVGLRPGPHEVVARRVDGKLRPLRAEDKERNQERAFSDQENFVISPEGEEIPGNRGERWPRDRARRRLWE